MLILNPEQAFALELLKKDSNIFLTGSAGTGKSFVINHFLKQAKPDFPVLASTGAAAVLLGGRTFHSFFGLGILEGGEQRTIDRASRIPRVVDRVRDASGVIIDEISMISGQTLSVAERIARRIRENERPWGGLKVIAVGDFHQLPPINRETKEKDWAFLSPTWEHTEFKTVSLKTIERAKDEKFVSILNDIRSGEVNERVMEFMQARSRPVEGLESFTRLFPFRDLTEKYNLDELLKLKTKPVVFRTKYTGSEKGITDLKKNAPILEEIQLKIGALVMIRSNDIDGRWVNGSTGILSEITDEALHITLKNGKTVEIELETFDVLDADGEVIASATNFPISLAYATTIHKAQGMTIDKMVVNLKRLWEPGHAYVALSRVREGRDIFIEAWEPRAIFTDERVRSFYNRVPKLDMGTF